MKPSDVYIGVIDLFAVLLPGAIFTAFLAQTSIPRHMEKAGVLVSSDDPAVGWVAFSVAAYAIGHLIFMMSAYLDTFFDGWYRDFRWPDHPDNAYNAARRLRDEDLGRSADKELMNPFTWAKCVLVLEMPLAAQSVQRFEADSKFFRSLFAVLLLLSVLLSLRGLLAYAGVCLALAVPAFLRYAERRHKSAEWAYCYAITLEGRKHGVGPT